MATTIIIRPEQPRDLAAVDAVHTAAFEPGGARAQDGRVLEVAMLDALRRDGDLVPALCLVAEVDGEVVGHVACSRGSIEGVIGVAPLAVHPRVQGQGVGTALMHSVVAAAEALWYRALVLLGDPAYYGRFGFVPAHEHGIVSAHPQWPQEAFQLRTLPSSWPGDYRGEVYRYAPAIEAIS